MISRWLSLKWQSDAVPDKTLKKFTCKNITHHTPALRRLKSQITSTKFQMVRQAHHPEQSRRVNLKFQYPMTKTTELALNTNIFNKLA